MTFGDSPLHFVLQEVVLQHAEETNVLHLQRSALVGAPYVKLPELGRLDARILAHLDGLAVAGEVGTACCVAALESPGAGEAFASTVRALELRDSVLLDSVLELIPTAPAAAPGLASALGWVPATLLQGVVRRLLSDEAVPMHVALGLSACRMHRVDPGPALAGALSSPAPVLRIAALKAAGALGRVDLLPLVRQSLSGDLSPVAVQAAMSACLLGDRRDALLVLDTAACKPGKLQQKALALAICARAFEESSAFVRKLSASAAANPQDAAVRRHLVRALGLLGDPHMVPWLLDRMDEPTIARLAGEAFSWITGADLAALQLETLTRPDLPEQPSEDPDDENVAMDEDEGLPWPDAVRVRRWWGNHQAQMTAAAAAAGGRLFMGRQITSASALQVLADGNQRQRAHAAMLLVLLQPGRGLFPVAAPAWRQRRWLASERA